MAGLRASKGGNSVDLTQRRADALSGDWYRWSHRSTSTTPAAPKRSSSPRETLLDIAGRRAEGDRHQGPGKPVLHTPLCVFGERVGKPTDYKPAKAHSWRRDAES
jgi:hypothetical protein